MKLIAACIAALLCIGLSSASAAVAGDSVSLDPVSPKQGQTLVVRLSVPPSQAYPKLTFNNKTYRLFPDGDGARALIGIPADLKPGDYQLSVGDDIQSVHVKAGAFGVQRIRLPAGKDNFLSSPGEEEAVKAAKETVTDHQLWKGHFVRPSQARTSSQFGLRRMVNGRLLQDYFHSGLDYAGGLGSPVLASQRGRVIIAANKGWRLHGNCVAIDHGQGVISFYIHLSKVLVKPGQMVDAGTLIGKVGATGRASGPHLHFSLYVNGNATSPSEWYTRTI
jgi:murein DD-endopeptidase MepM/ murein hydrolase activator NlpD